MIKLVIISLLVLQTSASFFEAFNPIENSLGRLVTDVVSDIKETIDCTILAVENVFSLGGLFGSQTTYDERCRPQSLQTAELDPYAYTVEQTTYATPAQRQPKEISIHIDQSISEASAQIKTIMETSNASEKIENVKNTLKSETDRLVQISEILRRELSKLPEEVKKKFDFTQEPGDHPSIETLLEEVKMLYRMEQEDKSSAQANEVRRSFDEILKVLHVNDTGGTFSDAEEVKEIIRNLGKMSNDSFIDVEKQVEEWTEEQNKQLDDIKLVVLNTESKTQISEKNKTETETIINQKLDEIEKEQVKMIDFSNTLKDMAKNILEKVSATTVAPKDSTSVNDDSSVENSTEKLSVPSTQLINVIPIGTTKPTILTAEITTTTNSPLVTNTIPITTSTKESTLESTTTSLPSTTTESSDTTTLIPEATTIITTTSLPPTTTVSSIPTSTLVPESATAITTTILQPTTSESSDTTTLIPEATTIITTTSLPPTTTVSSIPTSTLVPESATTITTTILPPTTTESTDTTTLTPEATTIITTTSLTPTTTISSIPTSTLEPESTITTTILPLTTTESSDTTTLIPEATTIITTTSLPPTTTVSSIPTSTLVPESATTITTTILPPTTTESSDTTTSIPEATTIITTTSLPPTTTVSSIPTSTLVPESTMTITSTILPPVTTESLVPISTVPQKNQTEPPVQSSTQTVYTTTPLIDTTPHTVAQTTSVTKPSSKASSSTSATLSISQTASTSSQNSSFASDTYTSDYHSSQSLSQSNRPIPPKPRFPPPHVPLYPSPSSSSKTDGQNSISTPKYLKPLYPPPGSYTSTSQPPKTQGTPPNVQTYAPGSYTTNNYRPPKPQGPPLNVQAYAPGSYTTNNYRPPKPQGPPPNAQLNPQVARAPQRINPNYAPKAQPSYNPTNSYPQVGNHNYATSQQNIPLQNSQVRGNQNYSPTNKLNTQYYPSASPQSGYNNYAPTLQSPLSSNPASKLGNQNYVPPQQPYPARTPQGGIQPYPPKSAMPQQNDGSYKPLQQQQNQQYHPISIQKPQNYGPNSQYPQTNQHPYPSPVRVHPSNQNYGIGSALPPAGNQNNYPKWQTPQTNNAMPNSYAPRQQPNTYPGNP